MYNTCMGQKPKLTAMNELHNFCGTFDFWMEIEKPFPSLDGLILKVVNSSGESVLEKAVGDVDEIDTIASSILGEISKEY